MCMNSEVTALCLFSSANKCLLKVATYAAQLEQYPKAIEIYEQVRPCGLCFTGTSEAPGAVITKQILNCHL